MQSLNSCTMTELFEWLPLQVFLVLVFIDDGNSVSYGKAIVAGGSRIW